MGGTYVHGIILNPATPRIVRTCIMRDRNAVVYDSTKVVLSDVAVKVFKELQRKLESQFLSKRKTQ